MKAKHGDGDPVYVDDDFGFHHTPEYVELAVDMLVNYGILPQDGGLDDQDWSILEDIWTWMRNERAIEDELYPEDGTDASGDLFDHFRQQGHNIEL